MTNLTFDAGATLTVVRPTSGPRTNKLGDRQPAQVSHPIGPCSIVDSHGRVNLGDDGTARWVGTVTVEVQVDNRTGELPDVVAGDRIVLPSGEVAIVVQPPEVPRNPFTGWIPYLRFTLASPGYSPAT